MNHGGDSKLASQNMTSIPADQSTPSGRPRSPLSDDNDTEEGDDKRERLRQALDDQRWARLAATREGRGGVPCTGCSDWRCDDCDNDPDGRISDYYQEAEDAGRDALDAY